jgi:hypothetical protein
LTSPRPALNSALLSSASSAEEPVCTRASCPSDPLGR